MRRLPKLLGDGEIAAVLALGDAMPWSRATATSARETCYLSAGGAFAQQLPELRAKLIAAATAADGSAWRLLPPRRSAPRL